MTAHRIRTGVRVIGVTGLPCSGKSFAASALADGRVDGIPGELVKADDLGHVVLKQDDVKRLMAEEFGPAITEAADPAAVRAVIAARVFSDPEKLAWLEGVIHPLVTEEVRKVMARTPGRVVVESALLFAADLTGLCDAVVLVEADRAARLERARRRGWNEEELSRRERRLLPQFVEEIVGRLGDDLIRVDNNADDGLLPERLKAAFANMTQRR